jgi:hypothetical protein
MRELVGYVDGLSNLCDSEQRIRAAIAAGRERPVPAWQHHLGANFGGEALRRVGLLPGRDGPANHPRWPMGWSGPAGLRRPVAAGPAAHLEPPGGSVAGAAPCPTGWPWSSHRAATPSWSAGCTPTTRPRAATAGCWPTVRRPPLVTRSPMARTRRDNAPVPPAPSGSSATARAPRRRCGTSPSTWSSWWPAAPAGRAGGDPSRWTSTPSGSSWPRRRPRPAGRPPRPAAAGRTAISTPRGWQLDR